MKFGKDLNIVCKVQLEKIMSLKPTHSCCCSPAEIVDHVGLEELVQKDRINSLKQFFTSVDLILKSGITFTATNKMLVAVNEERTDVFDIIALTSYQDNTESYSLGMDLDALAHLTRASRACGRHQIDHAIAQCQLHLTKIVDHLHLLARSLENSNVNRTQMAKLMRDLDQVMKSTMQAIAGLSPIENDIPLLSSLIKQSRNLVYMVPTWHPNSDMTLSRLIGWTQCLLARTRYILLRPRWEQKTLSFMWSPCLVSILSYITNSFIKCIGSKPLSDDILDYLCSVGFTSFIDPSFSFCVEFLSSVIFAFKSTGEITLSKAHDTYIVNIPIINSKTSLNLENLRIKIFFVVCGDYVSSSVANEWIASHRSWRKHSVEKRILGFGNNTNNLTRANFVKSVNQLHFRLFDRALFCHIINLKSHENQSADGWDTRLGELVCE